MTSFLASLSIIAEAKEQSLLVRLIPFLVLFAILYVLYKRSSTSKSYLDRCEEHMKTAEAEAKIQTALLKEIRDEVKGKIND